MHLKLFNIRLAAEQAAHDQEVVNSFMDTVEVKKSATQYVPGNPDYWSILVYYETNGESHSKETPRTPAVTEGELNEDEKQILAALKTWRKDKAAEIQHPEYLIFHNATLISLAKEKPRSLTDLTKIKGMGQQKVAQYGDDVMAILNAF